MDDSDGDDGLDGNPSINTDSIEYKFTIDGWSAQENFTQVLHVLKLQVLTPTVSCQLVETLRFQRFVGTLVVHVLQHLLYSSNI